MAISMAQPLEESPISLTTVILLDTEQAASSKVTSWLVRREWQIRCQSSGNRDDIEGL
jgi:hypothetical protein